MLAESDDDVPPRRPAWSRAALAWLRGACRALARRQTIGSTLVTTAWCPLCAVIGGTVECVLCSDRESDCHAVLDIRIAHATGRSSRAWAATRRISC